MKQLCFCLASSPLLTAIAATLCLQCLRCWVIFALSNSPLQKLHTPFVVTLVFGFVAIATSYYVIYEIIVSFKIVSRLYKRVSFRVYSWWESPQIFHSSADWTTQATRSISVEECSIRTHTCRESPVLSSRNEANTTSPSVALVPSRCTTEPR